MQEVEHYAVQPGLLEEIKEHIALSRMYRRYEKLRAGQLTASSAELHSLSNALRDISGPSIQP